MKQLHIERLQVYYWVFLAEDFLIVLPNVSNVLIEFLKVTVKVIVYHHSNLGQVLRRNALNWLSWVRRSHVATAGMKEKNVYDLHTVRFPVCERHIEHLGYTLSIDGVSVNRRLNTILNNPTIHTHPFALW